MSSNINSQNHGAAYTTRGLAAFQKAAEEKKQANSSKFDPKKNRFELDKGESRDIIILDEFKSQNDFDAIGKGLFNIFEHKLLITQGGQGRYVYETCINDSSICPLCDKYDAANRQMHDHYAVAFLTVLDLTGYTKKDGTVVAPVKKLLPIKPSNLENIKEYLDMAIAEDGTTRGLKIRMKRGTDTTAAKIGEVVPMGKIAYQVLSEDELLKTYGHPEQVGQSGTVWKKANEDLLVFDYESIFKPKTTDELAKLYGSTSSQAYSSESKNTQQSAPVKNAQVEAMKTSNTASSGEEYNPFEE